MQINSIESKRLFYDARGLTAYRNPPWNWFCMLVNARRTRYQDPKNVLLNAGDFGRKLAKTKTPVDRYHRRL